MISFTFWSLSRGLAVLIGLSFIVLCPRWCNWLRHCDRSRKIADSIPDVVIDIFHYGPAVNSASNKNEYQGYLMGVKAGRRVKPTNLRPSCAEL